MQKGVFIVFEGIDGSGTSTHVHKLEERIEQLNKYQDVLRTHEPWRSSEIKKKLEHDKDAYSDGAKMAELYVEDRIDHTKKIITPNLRENVVVLCSRYKMSTCAYQWTQGVELEDLFKMHQNRGILTPDLTFLLDVPNEVAEERLKLREKMEKFEANREFRKKLISAYHNLFNMSNLVQDIFGNVVKIDVNREIEDVAEDIFQEFLTVYQPH